MGNSLALRALLVTQEETTIAGFSAVCNELGIEAEARMNVQEIEQRLSHNKYAAVVLDFDAPEAGEQYLPRLQESTLNKNCVVVAVAANAKNLERALRCRVHFVLKRPMQEIEIRRTLRAAYDFMLSDQQRPFRCSSILPVRLRLVRSGGSLECSTVNISGKGVAIYSSMRLKPAESVDLEIVLPDGFVVLASGLVVWDDGLGKSGINFQVRTPEIRQKLDTWLNAQADSVAKLELTGREFSQILPSKEGKALPDVVGVTRNRSGRTNNRKNQSVFPNAKSQAQPTRNWHKSGSTAHTKGRAEQARRQEDNCSDQCQHAVHRDSHNPEGQQQQPNDGIEH